MPKIRREFKYKTYDTSKGYGNPEEWRRTFNQVIGKEKEINAFDILGIPKNSSDADIKKSYRRLAIQYHPDKTQGDTIAESKFKEISKAYMILTGKIQQTHVIVHSQPKQQTQTTILPQLLNEIEEHELERYLNDTNYCAQEKFNGRRRLIKLSNNVVTCLNKKGQTTESHLYDIDIQNLNHSELILDGEEVNGTLHNFDILSLNNTNLRSQTYLQRIRQCTISTEHIKPIYTAFTTATKYELLNNLKAHNREGIIFKLLTGIYVPGYSNDHVKYKFYATASVIVLNHNQRNSIEVGVYENSRIISMGNVTMLGHEKPPINSVVEVRYLYANRGGCLYQTTYLNPRDDVDITDCTIEKLKFKE